jgi:hypothetical protein
MAHELDDGVTTVHVWYLCEVVCKKSIEKTQQKFQ